MAKFKSLFRGKKDRHVKPPEEVKGSSKSPGIVARLMGLEMLPETTSHAKTTSDNNNNNKNNKVSLGNRVQPGSDTLVDITASGDQLNKLTSRRKTKSFDDGAPTLSSIKVVNSPELRAAPSPQETQSLQLEEINRQLLSRHLQIVDELSAQLTPRQGRGLSDSSELQDAVDLLQANKQLFEKYLRNSGPLGRVSPKDEAVLRQDMQDKRESKTKVTGRIPQYLNGQSSPRPPLRPEELERHRNEEPGSNIVVLKPKKSRNHDDKHKQEKPDKEHHHGKHIAKVFAKKIKDSLTKEVAKTFYSNVDSAAASPRKGSSRKQKHSPDSQSVESVEKKKTEFFPRRFRQSSSKEKGSEVSKSTSSSTIKAQAAALVAEKQVPNKAKTGALAKTTSQQATDKTSTKTAGKSKESRSAKKLTTPAAAQHEQDVPSEASPRGPSDPGGAGFKSPTKSMKVASDAGGENKYSPVSVLDLIDEEEIDDDVVDIVGVAAAERLIPAGKSRVVKEELICPPGKEEDLSYLKKLLSASSDNGSIYFLDPSLFETLEGESYSEEMTDEQREQAHLQAVNRWVIFDFVSDTLSNQSTRSLKTGTQVLKELWGSICELYRLQSPEQGLQALVGFEFPRDRSYQEEVSELCQQIENAIFNDLIDETISKLV